MDVGSKYALTQLFLAFDTEVRRQNAVINFANIQPKNTTAFNIHHVVQPEFFRWLYDNFSFSRKRVAERLSCSLFESRYKRLDFVENAIFEKICFSKEPKRTALRDILEVGLSLRLYMQSPIWYMAIPTIRL